MRRAGQKAADGQNEKAAWPLKADTPYFAQVAKHIRIQPSNIVHAGLGAFAFIDLPPNRLIGWYRGEKLTKLQFDERYPDGFGEYVLELRPNLFIDAKHVFNFTRMINDARGSGASPNLEFTHLGALKTLRKIRKGEELFLDYGNKYFLETSII